MGMDKCNCVYEEFCSMINGEDIVLPRPCEYRKSNADIVKVVRCKDCKHWDEYHIRNLDGPGMGVGMCIADQHNWIEHRIAEDFCSYGERKDHDST